MSEEELDAAGALAVDEDQDELMEEMSIEERKERLKKTRWNVFLYLGIAAILFLFIYRPYRSLDDVLQKILLHPSHTHYCY